eukprot:GDKI01031494.1.p1 GENE.GDKI01031494.1~~GDKI01031494.1.p1  ORF type:complete len:188 (+),score=50.54 GDKI01031494.1:41-604(+)
MDTAKQMMRGLGRNIRAGDMIGGGHERQQSSRNPPASDAAHAVAVESGPDSKKAMDSAEFNSHKYVAKKLKNVRMPELLRECIDMHEQIEQLDGDMKMLVYENYGKFMDGTDSVQKVRTLMEASEGDVGDIRKTIDQIWELNDALCIPAADQMRELTRLRELLEKAKRPRQLQEILESQAQRPGNRY